MKAESQGGVAAVYRLHADSAFLADSIAALEGRVPVFVFVSRLSRCGEPGDWEEAAAIAAGAGAEVIEGEWVSEDEHKRAAIAELKSRGYSHALIPESDEVLDSKLLGHLLAIAENDLADRVYAMSDAYWKTVEYVVRPREDTPRCILVDLYSADHTSLHDQQRGRRLVLGEDYGLIHRLTFVGSDDQVRDRLDCWSDNDELVSGWWQSVWRSWESNKCLRNLHPTRPESFRFAERIEVPQVLADLMNGRTSGICSPWPAAAPEVWPRVSIVIPVHGGAALLRSCLESLSKCADLVHEVIVIDNASPDDCLRVRQDFDFVVGVENDENLGFSKACNQGFGESTGDIVLFLNSDTIVPRSGLIRLIEPLIPSGTIAASGPLTNNCGHLQRIDPTYTDRTRIDLFADDFANVDEEPREVDMLVGFCLAVKRTALEDVGPFDERFGLGTFEDNDLCHRLRRSGWRLVIASNSFVHHEGSQTLRKVAPETGELLRTNEKKFREKWRTDIESGYASHLAGTSAEPIKFDEARKPELRLKEIGRKRTAANISLCMIVRDEERVLANCLESAKPFFKQMIIVDTGSTDKTVEIAKSFGAEVRQMEWPDSFSVARNESMRGAKGDWLFWLDADDTLPLDCGEAILDAVMNAKDDVIGFVVPVQFVEDGPSGGTRVDHVKLFRNLPGLEFEGRIHEQILGKLKQHPGKIARCSAHVLHSGYDTSESGQRKKRVRDEKLLKLDLEDRPDHPFVLFNLGMTAHYTDGHEEALKWFDRCLEVSNPNDSHVRKTYSLKAVSHRELGQTGEAIHVLEEGLSIVGDDPELHFHLALMLSNAERCSESLHHYTMVAKCDPSTYYTSMDVGILGFKCKHNMAGVLIELDRYEEAKVEYKSALELAPHYMPSAFALFDHALKRQDIATAQYAIQHVTSNEGERKSWAEMRLKLAENVGGPENVHATFTALSERNIHAAKSYSTWLLKQGMEQEASSFWPALSDQGDAESAFFLGISETRKGRFKRALDYMQRALTLNPGHEETLKQVEGLERAIAAEK
ncbi:MAG: glycosyltransferase [Armatimonadetes bacterium]|nr:glycosyltransferase [Armatimonadota bacterium]